MTDLPNIRDYVLDNGTFDFEKILSITEPDDDKRIEQRKEIWGCKWTGSEASIVNPDAEMKEINFLTPWTPPIGAIEALAKKYEGNYFYLEYHELGSNYRGETEFSPEANDTWWDMTNDDLHELGYMTPNDEEEIMKDDDAFDAYIEIEAGLRDAPTS
jgi:hypothetical protein